MSRWIIWYVVGALVVIGIVIVISKNRPAPYSVLTNSKMNTTTPDREIREDPGGGYIVDSGPGRFSSWLPGWPYRTDQRLESPHGPVDLHAFSHDGMRVSCTVSFIDRAARDERTHEQVFAEAGDNVAKIGGGSVLQRREVMLGRHQGQEILTNAMQPKIGTNRARIFIVGARLYTLSVFTVPGAEVDPEVDRCLDSLAVETDGGTERLIPAPPAPTADLSDVIVFFTQDSPPGTKRTLLVHRDGVVELVQGSRDGPVVRRLPKGRADLAKLERVFAGSAWAALPEARGMREMYTIESHGHSVKRSDPINTSETVFLDALSYLGELWIYTERADRPSLTAPSPAPSSSPPP
jgi:hypothetical protein